jgi:hypothetical protein
MAQASYPAGWSSSHFNLLPPGARPGAPFSSFRPVRGQVRNPRNQAGHSREDFLPLLEMTLTGQPPNASILMGKMLLTKYIKSPKKQHRCNLWKGVRILSGGCLNIFEACEKAAGVVSHSREMDQLYRRAVRSYGEGELRIKIMETATDALGDDSLLEEVFSNDESLLSFLCGVWIHVLLTEFAGVERDRLKAIAKKVFMSLQKEKSFH